MKFYFSSFRIPDIDIFASFVGKALPDISIGLILNAQDYKTDEKRAEKKQELFSYFKGLGFNIEEVDLREYDTEDELKSALKNYDVMWFNGGNTFCLRWVIDQSVLTKGLLKDVLKFGTVYAGDSAGAIIVGPTLKHFDAADDPDVVPEAIYDGLGLVDFVVLPHYESEKHGEIVKGIGKELEEDGRQTKPLTDEEFILMEDGEIISDY